MALTEKPSPAFKAHLEAIEAGEVTKTNVIGIRKLLNGAARRRDGLSIGRSTPKGTMEQAEAVVLALHKHLPRTLGELTLGGIKVLTNPRYRKRWTAYEQRIIDTLDGFRLVDYEWLGDYYTVPIFRAIAENGDSFDFRNVPWQAGGNGPEVVDA